MTHLEIVKKLIGNIKPIGETTTDNERFENLKAMCLLLDQIHAEIDDLAFQCKGAHQNSIKRAGEYADEFLTKLGITE